MTGKRRPTLSELVVHIGAGFVAKERPHVREALSTLRPHLGRWDADDVSVEVSLHDRGRREQRVTLRTTLPGRPPLVAVAADTDLTRALHEAKHELIRQIEQQKAMREPMHNRRLSGRTIRHPVAAPRRPTASPGA
ncbi:MAG: hypothetical protein U1D00_11155 [Mycobacterium sp.]|nr:hypothetical protein [Mycobacterium sp.]